MFLKHFSSRIQNSNLYLDTSYYFEEYEQNKYRLFIYVNSIIVMDLTSKF